MSGAATALEPAPATSWSVRSLVRLRRLATALAVLAVAEAATVILFSVIGRERFAITLDPVTIGLLGSVILFPIMGALIIQRRPLTRIAWLMIWTGVGMGLGLVMYGYGVIGLPPGPERPFALQALTLSQLLFVPSIACGTALLLPLFPTDRLIGPRWRIVVVITVIGVVVFDLAELFRQGELDKERFPGLLNPLGAPADWTLAVDVLSLLGNALVSVAVLLGALSLVVRYRRADAVEAAQLRWFALVAGLAAVAFAISSVPIEPVSDIAFGAGLVLLSLTPIAIGIAITRYRLFEIDRLINRTLVYGSLTAILAGVFTAAIGLAQRVFVAATGETSDAAIVLTTLVVATLYAPLRKRLEAIVDRRFRYDERRFGPYRDEVQRILSVLEPRSAADRLASEAMRELAATGAAVLGADDRPTAHVGEWPLRPAVRLAIPARDARLAAIVVGPRIDGRPHDPRSIAELQEVVVLAAAAVEVGGEAGGEAGVQVAGP